MSCAQCAECVIKTFLWNPCHIRAGSLGRSCWVPKNAEREGAQSRVYYIGAAPQRLGVTRSWRSDIPKDSDRSQCKRTRLIAGSLLRLCALTWARQRSSSDDGATSFRFYCVLIRTQSHGAYLSNGVLGDSTVTNEDAAVLLCRCRRLYCAHIDVLNFSWMQQGRLKDAPPVWQGFNNTCDVSFREVIFGG